MYRKSRGVNLLLLNVQWSTVVGMKDSRAGGDTENSN